MHCLEILRGFHPCQDHDGRSASGMVLQIGRSIVHSVVDHYPSTSRLVVLGYFLQTDAVLQPLIRRFHQLANFVREHNARWRLELFDLCHLGSLLDVILPCSSHRPFWSLALGPWSTFGGNLRIILPRIFGHPATCLVAWHGRVLKPNTSAVLQGMDFDAEEAVVHHAHDIPSEVHRLHVLVRIHCSAANLFAVLELCGLNFCLPPGPTPMLVCAAGCSNLIFGP
mmetsp:Transcript_11590/g.20026  ORF Transcript_11590/g.20026 Transcript_11590/m.20026 type:complete len:225 (-) Transcript_11590:1302-1976(-)